VEKEKKSELTRRQPLNVLISKNGILKENRDNESI
jgi:hypothetical protein